MYGEVYIRKIVHMGESKHRGGYKWGKVRTREDVHGGSYTHAQKKVYKREGNKISVNQSRLIKGVERQRPRRNKDNYWVTSDSGH